MSKKIKSSTKRYDLGGLLSGAATGAISGSALSPIGAVIGGGVGILSSLLGESAAKKEQKRLEKRAQRMADSYTYLSDSALLDEYNKLVGQAKRGGKLKPKAEVEKGEYLLSYSKPVVTSGGGLTFKGTDPNTKENIYEVTGKPHSSGGVDVVPTADTKVISKNLGFDKLVEEGNAPSSVYNIQEMSKKKKFKPGGFMEKAKDVVPFISELYKLTQNPPKPIAPVLQKPLTATQVSFEDQINESNRRGLAVMKGFDQSATNPNAFKASVLSSILGETNRIRGEESRQNAFLRDSAKRINANIDAGNVARTNQYLAELLQSSVDRMRNRAEALAGASDKFVGIYDRKQAQSLADRELSMMENYYGKSSDLMSLIRRKPRVPFAFTSVDNTMPKPKYSHKFIRR